jgi:hypothetical protein
MRGSVGKRPDNSGRALVQHLFYHLVWASDHVRSNQFACPLGGGYTRVDRCLDGTNFASHHYRHVPAADLLLAEQGYISYLGHGIGRFD